MAKGSRDDKIKDLSQLISAKRVKMSVDGKMKKTGSSGSKPASSGARPSSPASSSKPAGSSRPAAKKPHRPLRMHRPVKDFSKEEVFIKRTTDPLDEADPSKLRERVKEEVKKILEKKKGYFTGSVKIGFEASKIVDIDIKKVEVDEDLDDKLISADNFDKIIAYLENPDPRDKEMAELSKGIPIEKMQKAKDLGADSLIKKAKVKLDGTVQYTIIASVND